MARGVTINKYLDQLKENLTKSKQYIVDNRNTKDKEYYKQLARLKRFEAEMKYYKDIAIGELARESAKTQSKDNPRVKGYIKNRTKSLEGSIDRMKKRAATEGRKKRIASKEEKMRKLKSFENSAIGFADYILSQRGIGETKSKAINAIVNSDEFTKTTGKDQNGRSQNLFVTRDANGNTIINEPNVELALAYVSGNKKPYETLQKAEAKDMEQIENESNALENIEHAGRFITKMNDRNGLIDNWKSISDEITALKLQLDAHPIRSVFMFATKAKRNNLHKQRALCEDNIYALDEQVKETYQRLDAIGALATLPNKAKLDKVYSSSGTIEKHYEKTNMDPNAQDGIKLGVQAHYESETKRISTDKANILKTIVPASMRTASPAALQMIVAQSSHSTETKETLESMLRITKPNGPLAIAQYAGTVLSPNEMQTARTVTRGDVARYARAA